MPYSCFFQELQKFFFLRIICVVLINVSYIWDRICHTFRGTWYCPLVEGSCCPLLFLKLCFINCWFFLRHLSLDHFVVSLSSSLGVHMASSVSLLRLSILIVCEIVTNQWKSISDGNYSICLLRSHITHLVMLTSLKILFPDNDAGISCHESKGFEKYKKGMNTNHCYSSFVWCVDYNSFISSILPLPDSQHICFS